MADDGDDKTMVMRPTVKKQLPPKSLLVAIDPAVLGTGGGAEIVLDGKGVTVGRGADSDVTLTVEGISRSHARLFPGDGVWGVEDLGSTNGVYVNKTKISGEIWIKPGDIISIGKVHYKLQVVEAKPEPAPQPEIDISDTDKTVVMRPAAKPEAIAAAAAAAKASPAPAATETTVAARPRATASASAASAKKSSGNMWLIVMLVGIVLIVGAFVLLVL